MKAESIEFMKRFGVWLRRVKDGLIKCLVCISGRIELPITDTGEGHVWKQEDRMFTLKC